MNKLLKLRLKKIIFVLFRPFFWKAILRSTYPSIEHLKVLCEIKYKKRIFFILDVGANKGQFSLIANYLFPKAEIFAFEPLDKPANNFEIIF